MQGNIGILHNTYLQLQQLIHETTPSSSLHEQYIAAYVLHIII